MAVEAASRLDANGVASVLTKYLSGAEQHHRNINLPNSPVEEHREVWISTDQGRGVTLKYGDRLHGAARHIAGEEVDSAVGGNVMVHLDMNGDALDGGRDVDVVL